MSACPPCAIDAPHKQHEYDDDYPFESVFELQDHLRNTSPGSRLGDPCVWCDHEKCPECPPPPEVTQ